MNKKLKKIVSVAAMAGLMVSMVLSFGACSSKKKLIIYNWGDYIGENTISKFQSKFPQYEVVYRTFETNETMYPNLSNGYDVIIPSDYMVCRLIEEDRIQQVDWSKLPNVEKNMDPMFRKVKYCEDQKISDSVLQYAVPYLYCTVGLVYDAKKVSIPEGTTDPKAIWAPLFDEANVNKVGMYDSMRESIGVALNYLGYSINSMDEAQLNEAKNSSSSRRQIFTPHTAWTTSRTSSLPARSHARLHGQAITSTHSTGSRNSARAARSTLNLRSLQTPTGQLT